MLPIPGARAFSRVNLSTLKWLALAGLILFFICLQAVNWLVVRSDSPLRNLLFLSAFVVLIALTAHLAIFRIVERRERSLEQQRLAFKKLGEAGLRISGDLSLDSVLQRVTDTCRDLMQSRDATLSLVDEAGTVQNLLISGHATDADTPSLRETLPCQSPLRAILEVSRRVDGAAFDENDRATLGRFASQAAIAIDNAHSHRRARNLAISEERLRISKEMHDGVAQVLAYCNTKLQAIGEFLRSGRTEEAGKQLEQLARTSREVYADVREGILGLRTVGPPQTVLTAALQEYVELWQEQSGIPAELLIDEGFELEASQELQLVRIVQEALSNVRKHSRARKARVEMKADDHFFRVIIEDDGTGFEPERIGRTRFPRFGLATMRERAESIRGRFEVYSKPGNGTRVQLDLRRPETEAPSHSPRADRG